MRAENRALGGIAIAGVSLALILAAGGQLYHSWQSGAPAAATKTPRERAFSVEVATLEAVTVTPVITGYGHLVSGRSLELRSAASGALIELSENFRDGGHVAEGEVLFRIDPARLNSARALAESNVAQAEADIVETQAALELARLEANAADTQFGLRDAALTRQESLRERGVATEADVEAAVLARAAAEQTLINRRQIVAGAEARVAAAKIALERQKNALVDATRAVDEATVSAPFDGVISEPKAVAGRLVTANEVLGTLIDPAQIEVAFRVTNAQFARLLNAQGALRKAEGKIEVRTGRNVVDTPAVLVRAGAETGDGQVGRLVYARLTDPDPALVQPGDFVTVELPERPLEGVAVIASTAASADGHILVLGEGNRLEDIQATPVRRQGDTMIVTDVPFGKQYVRARALQLGAGIQVEPVVAAPVGAQTAAAPAAAPAPDTIALDDTRRAAIVAFIEASQQMKPEMREKFLEELSRPEVPIATVEKFEAKIAEGQ